MASEITFTTILNVPANIGFLQKIKNLLQMLRNGIYTGIGFIRSSSETLGNIGTNFTDSAKADLASLKDELTNLWQLKDEEKKSAALLIANIVAKAFYIICIVLLTFFATAVKISLGFVCMALSGNIFRFVSILGGILLDVIVEGSKIAYSYIKGFINVVLNALKYAATNIGDVCARITAATVRTIESGLVKLGQLLNLGFNKIVQATFYVEKLLRAVLNQFKYAAESVVNIGIEIIKRITKAIGNLTLGIPFLILGAFKAAAIIIQGVGLSIGALFFETGLSTAMSGVAKSIFILEEAIADALDALRDGMRNFISIAFPRLTTAFDYNELEIGNNIYVQPDIILPPATHTAGNAVRYINRNVIAHAGVEVLKHYKSLKARHEQHPRPTRDKNTEPFRHRNRQDNV